MMHEYKQLRIISQIKCPSDIEVVCTCWVSTWKFMMKTFLYLDQMLNWLACCCEAERLFFSMDVIGFELVLQFPMNHEILGVLPCTFKIIPNMHVHSRCLSTEIMEPGGIEMTWDQVIKEGLWRGLALGLSYVQGPYWLPDFPFCQLLCCFRGECGGNLLIWGTWAIWSYQ